MSDGLVVIGGGAMGGAIVAGLVADGRDAGRITVAERSDARRADLAARLGVQVSASNTAAAANAGTVLLAVKPLDAPAVLDEIRPVLGVKALVVSVCAGVSTAALEAHLNPGQPVVRVMPNTPAAIGAGMSVLSAGSHVDDSQLEIAVAVMAAVGKTVVVPERLQDAATAVSGSGPAYLFYVAEAMTDAGVLLGLPRDVARELAVQTLFGSASLLRESGESATTLRERVCSPGGTTAAALREFDREGLRSAVFAGMEACRNRSAAMGTERAG